MKTFLRKESGNKTFISEKELMILFEKMDFEMDRERTDFILSYLM